MRRLTIILDGLISSTNTSRSARPSLERRPLGCRPARAPARGGAAAASSPRRPHSASPRTSSRSLETRRRAPPPAARSGTSQTLTLQEVHGRRSSDGHEGAGQLGRPEGAGQPRRALIADHAVQHHDKVVYLLSHVVKLLLQLPDREPAASQSNSQGLQQRR